MLDKKEDKKRGSVGAVKPKASKGVKIMDRDIDVFQILSSGAMERESIRGNPTGKPVGFPRIRLNYNGKENTGNFHVEIDNNTIVPNYVREKVRKMSSPTLILCTTKKRMVILQFHFKAAYDIAVPPENDKTPKSGDNKKDGNKNPDKNLIKVHFALTSDFCASNGGGFLNTRWETIAGTRAKIFQL